MPVLAAKAAEQDVRFHGFPFRHQFDLATIRRLRRLIRDERPDVIHVHKGIAHALALAATWRQPVGAFVVNRGVSFPLDRLEPRQIPHARASTAWSRSASRSRT